MRIGMRELAYPLNATIFSIPPIFHSVIDKPETKSYVRKNVTIQKPHVEEAKQTFRSASAEKFSCMISLLDHGEERLHMFAQSVTAASVPARNASSTPPF